MAKGKKKSMGKKAGGKSMGARGGMGAMKKKSGGRRGRRM